MFSGITAGVKNIGSSVDERTLSNVSTMDTKTGETFGIVKTATGTKRCKVKIMCEDAKKLATTIAEVIKTADSEFKKEITSLGDVLKSAAINLDKLEGIKAYLKRVKDIESRVDKLVSEKTKIRTKERNIEDKNIIAAVYIKTFSLGSLQDPLPGKLKTINIAQKTVSIEFETPDKKKETLYGFEINKLCIEPGACPLPSSGGKRDFAANSEMTTDQLPIGGNQDSSNYFNICE